MCDSTYFQSTWCNITEDMNHHLIFIYLFVHLFIYSFIYYLLIYSFICINPASHTCDFRYVKI